jgi:hypothetical protein
MQGPFGVHNATLPDLNDKDQAQLQLNSDGSLKVGGAGHGLNGALESVACHKGQQSDAFIQRIIR